MLGRAKNIVSEMILSKLLPSNKKHPFIASYLKITENNRSYSICKIRPFLLPASTAIPIGMNMRTEFNLATTLRLVHSVVNVSEFRKSIMAGVITNQILNGIHI